MPNLSGMWEQCSVDFPWKYWARKKCCANCHFWRCYYNYALSHMCHLYYRSSQLLWPQLSLPWSILEKQSVTHMCFFNQLLWPVSKCTERKVTFFRNFLRFLHVCPWNVTFSLLRSNIKCCDQLVEDERLLWSDLYCPSPLIPKRLSLRMQLWRILEDLTSPFMLQPRLVKFFLSPPGFCPCRNRHHF